MVTAILISLLCSLDFNTDADMDADLAHVQDLLLKILEQLGVSFVCVVAIVFFPSMLLNACCGRNM